MEDFIITEDDVSNSIKEMNPNETTGPDKINPKLIIECKEALIKPLSNIFNESLKTSTMPNAWKNSVYMSPIFEFGDKYLPSNYRPISICKPYLLQLYAKYRQ